MSSTTPEEDEASEPDTEPNKVAQAIPTDQEPRARLGITERSPVTPAPAPDGQEPQPEQEQPPVVQAITVPDAEPLGYAALVATSPHSTLLAILTALMALTIVLLGFAIGSHLRHQYVEVIGGGLALLILIMLLTFLSIHRSSQVEIPVEGPGGSTMDTTATENR
jgi:hypothetical protein